MRQQDLFATLTPECGSCPNLGSAIDSGVRYCWGELTWRWADERVEGCAYRGRVIERHEPPPDVEIAAITDLLESPRHSISDKDRAWLRAERRRAAKDQATHPHQTEDVG